MDSFVQELSSMQEAAASVEQSLLAERNKTKRLQQQLLDQEVQISQLEHQVEKNDFDYLKNVTEINSLKTSLMSLARQVDELLEYKKKLLSSSSQEQQDFNDNKKKQQNNKNNNSSSSCPFCSTLVASWNLIQHPHQVKKSKHASELSIDELLSKNEILVATGKLSDD